MKECVDKSMRMGNNECHVFRTHCASCRSLRDDPNYDSLIAILYPDIDKYEEEVELKRRRLAINSSKDTSSTDECSTGLKSKEDKTLSRARTSQPSSEANAHVGSDDNDSETNRELLGATSGFLDSSEIPAWGSGGMSRDSRHCSPSEATYELSKNKRVSELTESLLSACENDLVANNKN
ncbi:hypothetical protein RD792_007877 [Penstemon davidsonii]|uniref:Uncharacterized protein n=1 Tax=Penstemon davidsonii TaxID=160366 RepID=A0ABR0D7K1_9LAMI|nr:hypothetical protein RD792_007877 [Penstemon davidsonii]